MAILVNDKDIERLKAALDDYDFDNFNSENCYYLYDALEEQGFCGSVDNGATKAVFIMEDRPYVLKFPFYGIISEYISEEEEETGEPGIEYFYNAPEDAEWDYCLTEVRRYEYAETECFEGYLAMPELLFYTKSGFPVYAQERCQVYSRGYSSSTLEQRTSADKILSESGVYYNMDLGWVADFMMAYGSEEMVRFLEFLYNNSWDDDLRNANIGYNAKGRPVLIDFASYCEQQEEEEL